MSLCKYVRKANGGWEFGHMRHVSTGVREGHYVYEKEGLVPSYEEALTINNMALKGEPRKGHNHINAWGKVAQNYHPPEK